MCAVNAAHIFSHFQYFNHRNENIIISEQQQQMRFVITMESLKCNVILNMLEPHCQPNEWKCYDLIYKLCRWWFVTRNHFHLLSLSTSHKFEIGQEISIAKRFICWEFVDWIRIKISNRKNLLDWIAIECRYKYIRALQAGCKSMYSCQWLCSQDC